ncbi:MAG: AAA family ATPase [Acidobacteria bacterium]|nr:AAA family ATPase [Acidobacteriota bacterium]
MAKKSSKTKTQSQDRPGFLEDLGKAYTLRRKNIVLLTGDIHGLFWSPKKEGFFPLEEALVHELSDKFTLVRMDIASGLTFYDKSSELEILRVCESKDGVYIPKERFQSMQRMLEGSRHSPLPALVLMKGIQEAYVRVRKEEPNLKPLCMLIFYAGALIPNGDFTRLGDLDRQRLVHFMTWVSESSFVNSPDLILLVNSVKSEINSKIHGLPHSAHIEISLPGEDQRAAFVDHFLKNAKVKFEGGKERFITSTAGLKLNHLKDLMEVSSRSDGTITKDEVVAQVNEILQAELGDIIKIRYPSHKPSDIIGYKETGEIFNSIFERCEDPETAVSAILVSGPNGAGKTYQLEAYASQSGRVVVELGGIRGQYFGETDRFFELLRWHIATFGKILILVDEAHTAFGSVHSSGTHETEMRLAGNIIKMMGDPTYLGKVLWGMMTSRPDELDPDIKSRAPIQVPIFDLEGEPRKIFLHEMFKRKKVSISDEDLGTVLGETDYYSARDYRNLVAEVLAQRRKKPDITVLEVLSGWHASKSIKTQREFQSLIAAMHCSYPNLLPHNLREMDDRTITKRVEELKWYLSK